MSSNASSNDKENPVPENRSGAAAANREETDPRLNPSLDAGDGLPSQGKTDGALGQRAQTPSSGVPAASADAKREQETDAKRGEHRPAGKTIPSDQKTKGTKADEIPLPTPTTQNDV